MGITPCRRQAKMKRHNSFRFSFTAIAILFLSLSGIVSAQEFRISSPTIEDGGPVPLKYTCDGDSISMPVNWSGAPTGTQYFAVSIWHVPSPPPGVKGLEPHPQQERKPQGGPHIGADGKITMSYWLLYDIPGDLDGIPEDVKEIGTLGYHDKMEQGYDPMCPAYERPGLRTYHITVWALSEKPKLSTNTVTRAIFLEAIKDITLAEDTIDYTFDRKQK
jgi:phosphatidylethanolamine-binding protein (PEBP) family uncharacterized protein